MKHVAPYLAVATVAAFTAFSLAMAQDTDVETQRAHAFASIAGPPPEISTWEYKRVVGLANDEQLAKIGAEGWEYAGPYGDDRYLFKRPKAAVPAAP